MILAGAPNPSPTTASTPPGLTDYLTGYGTVALAVVTVAAVIATLWITVSDRSRADRERRRDRQQDAARRLLGNIAVLIPRMWAVPNASRTSVLAGKYAFNPKAETGADAVMALQYGAHADVAGIGDDRAAAQYRTLAHLAQEVASGITGVNGERMAGDLRRYAIFVRVSLENLIEYGKSLDPGNPEAPQLARSGDQTDLWEPEHKPQAWTDALKREFKDPLYEPQRDRIPRRKP